MDKKNIDKNDFPWKGPRLFVPTTLEALVVSKDSLNLPWSFSVTRYNKAGKFQKVRPDLVNTGQKPETGITLHWALPDGMTHGIENADGEIVYPYAPNRWLVCRNCSKPEAWVLESDYLNVNDGTNEFLEPQTAAFTRIGKNYPLAHWKGDSGTPGDPFLRAIGPGDPAFAAYTANIGSVFSFYDKMEGLENTPDKVNYFVTGWYADPAEDPLFGKQEFGANGWTTLEEWEQLMNTLQWSVGDDNDLEEAVRAFKKWLEINKRTVDPADLKNVYPAQTLCRGMIFNINWLGSDGKLQSGVPIYRRGGAPKQLPRLVVGNTSIDALSALVEYELEGEHGAEISEFLEAFQYGFLSDYEKPGGKLNLDRSIFNAWFGKGEGGDYWAIEDPDNPDDPVLPEPWQNDLQTLNQQQQKYNRDTRALSIMQERLYGLWWKQGYITNVLWGSPPAGVTKEQLKKIQSDIKTGISTLKTDISGMQQTVSQDMEDIKKSIKKIEGELTAANEKNKTNFQLKKYDGTRFQQPNDPVALFYGAHRTYKHGEDGRFDAADLLFCRFTGQQIYGLEVTAKGGRKQAIIPDNIDIPIPSALSNLVPKEIKDVCIETFFLDTNNAEAIADKALELLKLPPDPSLADTVKKQQTLIWNADAHDIDKRTIAELSGLKALPDLPVTIPSKVGVSSWTPPWSPLFIAWEVNWYPSYKTADKALDYWEWNEEALEYQWKEGVDPKQNGAVTLTGQSLLTPKSAVSLKAKLEDYFAGHPKKFPQLKDFLDQVANWDFLSQAMDGLNDTLLALNSDQFNPPTEDLENLIGKNDQLYPNASQETRYFYPIRAGHMRITKLWVVDDFGQVYDLMSDLGYTPENFPLITGKGMTTEDSNLIQLPPRLPQHSRMLFKMVDADDDSRDILYNPDLSPICGWLLPNYLDKSIMLYDHQGSPLGEIIAEITAAGKSIRWDPAPDSGAPVGTPMSHFIRDKHMKDFVQALIAREDNYNSFQELLSVINSALGNINPPGHRDGGKTPVLIGRPLALVRARLQYELEKGPLYNQQWLDTAQKVTDGYENIDFPVRLGCIQDPEDGLVGYFLGDNYNQMNSLYTPEETTSGYIKHKNVDMTFGGSSVYITMLVDPRGSVHAGSGILPISKLTVPSRYVETPISEMEVTFRTGPLITDPEELRMPLPTEIHGEWSWLQHSGVTVVEEIDKIGKATQQARLGNKANTINEGWLKLSGTFSKKK